MNIILYRKAEQTDAAELAKLRVALLNEKSTYSHDQLMEAYENFRTYFINALSSGQFICWIATLDDMIISSAGAYFFFSPPTIEKSAVKNAFIDTAFTWPEHRGKGILKKLHEFLLKDLRSIDCGFVLHDANEAEKPLFQKNGFQNSQSLMIYVPSENNTDN